MRFILVEERQVDIDAFNKKFGDDAFSRFNKLKGRLKNNNVSVDIVYHTKNTSVDDMNKLLSDIEQRVVKDTETGETKLNRKLVAENEYYAVYDVLDWETAMNMGNDTCWCITGRYDTDGEVKPSQARAYFNEYLEKGIKSYLFFMPKKEDIEKYCLCITSDPKHFQYWDSSDYSFDIGETPINKTFPTFEFKGVGVEPSDGTRIEDGVLKRVNPYHTGEFVVPDGITVIGEEAFSYCNDITSVTIPNSVTSIEEGAFRACISMPSVTIGDSVKSIGQSAFSGCIGLTSVTIGNGVTTLERWAFGNCYNLVSVTLGNGLKTIESSAFSGCNKLPSIDVPSGVEKIDDRAFCECNNLEEMTIPRSVTHIGDFVLSGCYKLERINYDGTIEEWNQIRKGEGWDYNSDKFIIHCSDGDIES